MVKHKNEEQRLEALKSYQILDTPPESGFDSLVELAKHICETPIALISFVDEGRQWFKAKLGLEAQETPRDISFCTHAIQGSGLFEINDTLKDERFKENPLVTGEPFIRFYAGFPLTTQSGHNLGTLCVIDRQPRELKSQQKKALGILSQQVVSQLELKKANDNLKRKNSIITQQHDLLCEVQKISALTQASAKVAHEINNPLAIIQANVDILNSVDFADKKALLRDKLQVIYNNIDRIKIIIDEMKSSSSSKS